MHGSQVPGYSCCCFEYEALEIFFLSGAVLPFGLWVAGASPVAASSFSNWKPAYFNSSEINDLSISGAFADPDGDGHNNYLEFALQTDPRTPDRSPFYYSYLDGNGNLCLQFPRLKAHPGFLYVPQSTTFLGLGWQSGPAYLTELTPSSLNADYDLATVRDHFAAGATAQRFIRLLVDADSDDDGLPDSWELLNGLSPTNRRTVFAQFAAAAV